MSPMKMILFIYGFSIIPGTGDHYLAECLHSFHGDNSDELSFSAGDVLRVAPKHKQPHMRGWLLASNGDKDGIIPANYVKVS